MQNPDVSVITVTLNATATLRECLDSVARQTGIQVEHIVVDGGSTDGTLDILRGYHNPALRWISEPDKGIADAMNKGARMAAGNWLYFLQADDRMLEDNILQRLVNIPQMHRIDLIASRVLTSQGPSPSTTRWRNGVGWPLTTFFKMPFCHQGVLIAAGLWQRVGEYDSRFSVTMDYDWFLRARACGAMLLRTDLVIAAFGREGLSSRTSRESVLGRLAEEHAARMKNAPNGSWRMAYQVFRLCQRTLWSAKLRLAVP